MAKEETKEVVKTDQAKPQLSMSQRFTEMVVKEATSTGGVALTNFQKRLAQNYFVACDAMLRTAEEKRMKKSQDKRDPVALTWQNVNTELLARSVIAAARVGLDPAQKNHINLIPYKNGSTQKYDINFMEGYRGMELKAEKYGLDIPDAVTIEIVYSTDKFTPIKKDKDHPSETYLFEITNVFQRGEIIGGFYYYQFKADPTKNKLMIYTLADIEKRKPEYASAEFWGGEKTVWKDGKPTKEKQKIEGWFAEMVSKTLCRAAYGNITIDSQKIDDDYLVLQQVEKERLSPEEDMHEEITQGANKEVIDISHEVVKEPATEIPAEKKPEPEKRTAKEKLNAGSQKSFDEMLNETADHE
jgi:recombination protein RecT